MTDKQTIKQIARKMAAENGLINLSRANLSAAAGIPDGSFPNVMGCDFSELLGELKHEFGASGPLTSERRRADPGLRKDQLLAVGVEVAVEVGFSNITREAIANRAQVSSGLVTKYLGTMKNLRRAVMRQAIRLEVLPVIAHGLAVGDPTAAKVSEELKTKVRNSI